MLKALNVKRADQLLAELLPEHGPVRAVSRFSAGSVTGAYRVEFEHADSAPVVLKIYQADNSWWWAAKEAHALRFLTDHGIAISPRLLAFSRSAEAIGGRPCVVSSLRPGRALSQLDGKLTPDQRHEVYRQLGEVLARLHAVPADGYGYVNGEIRDPVPDNATHMGRIVEDEMRKFRENCADQALADTIAAYGADRASAFAECPRPGYCHGDVHEDNLLAEIADDGSCKLTGLLDPQNMHAGDPLMDIVRLDSFSMHDDKTKIAGLLAGYGVAEPSGQAGEWPEAWRSRLPLYYISLALELYNWFTITKEREHLPGLERELREIVGS